MRVRKASVNEFRFVPCGGRSEAQSCLVSVLCYVAASRCLSQPSLPPPPHQQHCWEELGTVHCGCWHFGLY